MIWLTGWHLSDFAESTKIAVVCMDTYLQSALDKLEKKVILEIWDAKAQKRSYYEASVQLSAIIDKNRPDTYKVKLPPSRYAIIEKGMLGGILNTEEIIEEEQLKEAKLIATLEIERELSNIQVYAYPEIWRRVAYNTYEPTYKTGEIKEQVKELIVDKQTLKTPEEIQSLITSDVEGLLGYYRAKIGKAIKINQQKAISFANQSFSDTRRESKKTRLIVGIRKD